MFRPAAELSAAPVVPQSSAEAGHPNPQSYGPLNMIYELSTALEGIEMLVNPAPDPAHVSNSFTGFKGVSFKTGSDPVTVVKLGRYRFNGRPAEPGVEALPANAKKHQIILQKDKAAPKDAGTKRSEWVATGVVDCSQSSTEGFQYVTLENPVTLEPNTQYYLASYEESSEYFYDRLTAQLNNLVYPITQVSWLGKYNYSNAWNDETGSPDYGHVNLIVK